MTSIAFDRSLELLDRLHHLPIMAAREARLRRMEVLLRALDDPHRAFRTVHVAGSSGKGSTTTMIGAILNAAGFRTGLFRSPHLESYRERISTAESNISVEDWERAFGRVWPWVEGMREGTIAGYDLGRPSHGEVLFALMALYFAERGIEWAAVETGLGGRLDATNVLAPDVAVVTNISLEHTQLLGNSIEAIAREKAAIIKAGGHAVTAAADPEALAVIRGRAREVGAPLLVVPGDVAPHVDQATLDSQVLFLDHRGVTIQAELHMAGHFQVDNAATAYAAALALRDRGVAISDEAVTGGLSSTRVPGRFEILSRDPLVVIDGAHNPAAARELRRSVQEVLQERRIVLLVAAMADKDLAGIARELSPLTETVYVTRVPRAERGASPARLGEEFARQGVRVEEHDDLDGALAQALETLDRGDALLVTGSLYLVGYVREKIGASVSLP